MPIRMALIKKNTHAHSFKLYHTLYVSSWLIYRRMTATVASRYLCSSAATVAASDGAAAINRMIWTQELLRLIIK